MTFQAIKERVKGFCGLTSPEADARVGIAINQHYRRVTSSLGLATARFVTKTVSTTTLTRTVTFTEIEKIDRIIDATTAASIRVLEEVSIDEIRQTQSVDAAPNKWAMQAADADSVVIVMDTAPTAVYSLQADGWSTLTDLGGTEEPAFPESFHDVLVWYVIAEEMLRKEKDKIALVYESKAQKLLDGLVFHLADQPTRITRQGQRG
jgi:hypothetical protein